MPKKRKQIYAPKPQSSPHPSLQSSERQHGKQTSTQDQAPAQVNDLLLRLRRVQAGSQVSNGVGSLTHISATPPVSLPLLYPPSQHQSEPVLSPLERMRARARQRRLPGPPAPPSWTLKQRATKSYSQLEEDASQKAKRLDRLPGLTLPEPGSLLFMCMRKLAVDWQASIHVDNGHWLSLTPQHLKQALLAFLLIYGPSTISLQELELLFIDEIEGIPGSGAENITHVHMGYATNPATGHVRGYRDVARFLLGIEYNMKSSALPRRPSVAAAEKLMVEDVPESWDAEDDNDDENEAKCISISKSLSGPRFAGLTHLSLAHASYASWKALLRDLTPHLKQLTHLSLAYWPQPCLLPNSRTATIRSPAGDVNVSATGYYNSLDGDWGEAAGILQQLGKDLICLKWLDLEGCSRPDGWAEALKYQGWRSINWAHTFRGLETLIIDQGHVPSSLTQHRDREGFVNGWATWAFGLFQSTARIGDRIFANHHWLTMDKKFFHMMQNSGIQVTAIDVQKLYLWLERENRVLSIADHINSMRRAQAVAQMVEVKGSPYPSWATGLVTSPERGSEAIDINYWMFKKIGLTPEEVLLCSFNLRRLLELTW